MALKLRLRLYCVASPPACVSQPAAFPIKPFDMPLNVVSIEELAGIAEQTESLHREGSLHILAPKTPWRQEFLRDIESASKDRWLVAKENLKANPSRGVAREAMVLG